jgi:peptidoglycan/xylan/chitin deacetylase (PgdA/CDA1 family)
MHQPMVQAGRRITMIRRSTRQRIRRHVGANLQSLAHATGIVSLAARASRIRGAVILMYHSIADGEVEQFVDPRNHVPPAVFEEQMEFLAANRTVTSLTDLVTMLRNGQSPDEGTAVVTFDDGYRDTLTKAAPILHHHRLPATVFLPTGYIDRGEPQWVDSAFTIFKHRTKRRMRWEIRSEELTFDLDNPADYEVGYRAVCQQLLSASCDRRRNMLDVLREQLKPASEPPKLTMSWDDVRALMKNCPNIEIGGHTVEHLDLTSADPAQVTSELNGCMRSITQHTGSSPRHFSFPYGRTTATLRAAVAQAGFISACGATRDTVVHQMTDHFALPRVEAPATMKQFSALTSGVNAAFWRRLGQ